VDHPVKTSRSGIQNSFYRSGFIQLYQPFHAGNGNKIQQVAIVLILDVVENLFLF
jgi:hypothetical protein